MKLKNLKPNPTNPRIVKDEKFNKLVKSILNFPQMLEKRPMVVDADNIVWGGNMRLKALQHIQKNNPDFANEFMPNGVLPEGWVSSAAGWTEEQKREFAIKDNVSIGEWDWDLLANDWEQHELEDWGVDLPEFEPQEEISEMIGNVKKAIQVEFTPDDYPRAYELFQYFRQKDIYLGEIIIDFLIKQKDETNKI